MKCKDCKGHGYNVDQDLILAICSACEGFVNPDREEKVVETIDPERFSKQFKR